MSSLAEPIGEAWMTGGESRFVGGAFDGQTLSEAWPAMPVEWTGTRLTRAPKFPLLVKFIFTEEKLSVQVHPGDEYATAHEPAAGGCGKTEMWYAMSARPGAEVMVGLKREVTRESFARAIAEGSAENSLEHVPLRAGDAVFVPAGTAHTIGAGLMLCEIQQHSDLTYRVYDYNRLDAQGRARELHVEKALAVLRFGPQMGGKIEPVKVRRGGVAKTFLAACRYFSTEKWESSGRISAATAREHFELLIVLEGSGEIHFCDGRVDYQPAQVWMLPAALGEFRLDVQSPTSLLRTYVPASMGDLARELAAEGVGDAERLRLVHA
jgi:mannose-6-phosphate isomerase